MNIRVRAAQPEDIDWLMSQLKKFSDFFGTRLALFGDETYSRQTLAKIIGEHLMFIAEADERGPIGFISGLVSGHIFNPKIRVLTEMFWWVDEAFRGSRAGLLLMDQFTNWGRANVDWIYFGIQHNTPVNERAFTSRGYRAKEKCFLLEIN